MKRVEDEEGLKTLKLKRAEDEEGCAYIPLKLEKV